MNRNGDGAEEGICRSPVSDPVRRDWHHPHHGGCHPGDEQRYFSGESLGYEPDGWEHDHHVPRDWWSRSRGGRQSLRVPRQSPGDVRTVASSEQRFKTIFFLLANPIVEWRGAAGVTA